MSIVRVIYPIGHFTRHLRTIDYLILYYTAAEDVAEPKLLADEEIVSQLVSMGFSNLHCQKAAINTSNAGVEEAMNWLLSHMDDAGI